MAGKNTTTTQTVRIGGKRMRLTTRNGKVTAKPAEPLEWELQAAQVRALRNMPEYAAQFLLAADMNAERRGPKARMVAIASGMTAGEPDLRVYGASARLLLIENKVGNGRLSLAQVDRHHGLRKLGYTVEVLRSTSEDEAADKAVALVRRWLAANSNTPVDATRVAC